MEEPDADARSREVHVAAARLEGEDGAGRGGLAMAATPEVGDGLGDDKMICGAQERRLSTEEDEEKEIEGGFAVQSVESVEAIPAPFEGRDQIGDEKGSSFEERPMDVDEEKRGSFPVESGESAESGNLRTCHVANGGLSNKTLCVTCGEAFCSKDVGCVHDTLDKATEGSQCERECLAGNQGDWVGGAEVETSIEDLQVVCEEVQRDDEGLSNSMKHDSKRWPRGVDGMVFLTDANNELKQDYLMPKIEAEISRSVCEDSVPSVSGSIDVSLDGKAGRVGEISNDSMTCHVANGRVWNKGLCTPFGKGSQSKDAGSMYDTVDKATEGSQCERDSFAGEGGVLCDGLEVKTSLEDSEGSQCERDSFAGEGGVLCDGLEVKTSLEDSEGSQCERDSFAGEGGVLCDGLEVKTSLEDLQMCCKEPHCDNEGLSVSVKFDIQWLPDGMDVTRLKKDANHELENDDLLPKVAAEVSRPVHEEPVPSIPGSYVVVSSDSKAGEIGEISEHRTAMEKVACGSQGGDMLSCESGFWKQAPGDKNQRSRMEVKTSEEHLQTCWMEACHENGGLSDSGKHDTEELPRGADGLRLMTDANHELGKDNFLPNIDAEVSWPLDVALVPSIYENPTDVCLDGKAGLVGKISENRTCLDKLACDSPGGDMLSCETGFRTEASGDENQHSMMGVSKGLTSSVCKDANMESLKACDPYAEIEIPVQQTDQKYGTSELPPERDLTSSSYNQPCEDEPCCSGRESSALCLGHQDSASVESGYLDHLAPELNACNCAVDKPCSVDLVKNGNDGESQNQKSAQLIVFRRRNPRRAASSRNPNLEKHDQINKASNSTRKSKKVESLSSLLQSTMIKFPNKTTKGRSGINRPLKSFAWGSGHKLMDVFGQNCGPSTSNSHPTYLEEERLDRRSDEKTQPSIRKSRSSRCSKNKCAAFSDIGYASDELNMQPTFSVTTDTNASSEGHIGNIPKLVPHALVNVSDDARKTAQCTEDNRTLKLTSIQTDRQQPDRGLDSVTKETGPAYIHGECAISTSEPSPNNADVGFSPDSVLEVTSVTCENNTSASHDVVRENLSDSGALTGGGLHASALSTSDFGKNHASSTMYLEQQATTVRGNENTRKEEISPSHAKLDNDIGEGKVQALEQSNAVRKIKNLGKQERQKKDRIKGKDMKNRSSTKISSSEASKLRASSNVSSVDPSELLLCTAPPKFGSCFEAQTSATQDLGMHEHDSTQGPSVTDNEKSLRHKKKDDHREKKGKVRDPHVKGKSKKKNIADDTSLDCGLFSLPSQLATDRAASHMNEQSNLSPATELAFKNSAAISTELPRNVACKTDGASVPLPLRAAWVCCDDCQKWRCIPAELADIIGETNCKWTCKDNRDKAFADCSIPQEKTNAEINAELELSDASADEADNDGSNSKASRAPSWTHVRSNLFLHRNRRTQSIDESMVCNCKPPQDGRMGCRDGCLNRMLNIECVKRTCPCGEHCSNQQFQRRNYAKLSWFHSGKKGFGLQLKEDVSEGRFLIEYVGEVLDITAYESSQRYYASKGQKHFYFMALNGGEVIDACTKGNLGRFINHSCSPNCRTEKWMVNGEVCIGIFAMRNIRKGEELTFDYNYVRVSGAAPQKCFCGTAKCRGYIGGDTSGADIIAQDAEAEHFDPMAVDKDAEEVLGANGPCSHSANPDIVEHETSSRRENSNDCPSATPEPHQQTSGTLFDTSEAENSLEALSPQDAEDVVRTPVHVSRTIESSLQQFSVYGIQSSECLQKTPNTMDESKASNIMNGSMPSSDLGSNLVPGFHSNKKNNVKHHRNVKPSSSPIDNEHILGVEGRLNNLLDGDGGISKQKDATNGYLKLLLVTAAEGDNAGGTSKSVRDLSLILDALLKTKSRGVLLDIISKNGLQMLHNILKQNRSSFHRIPIIRKLLKVLEFLASKGILTSEHINGGPRYAGMESFRDSMLNLTRHSDTQVHQIARNFRDRWIPRNIARSEPTENPHASTSAQDIQGISATGGPVSTSSCSTDWNFTRRKRKSRWDYQPDEHYKMVGLKIQKVCSGHRELDLQTGLMRNKLQGNWGTNNYRNDVPVMGRSTEGADDEAPPGFESQQECQPALPSLDWGVAPGFSMDRYQPNLSISYGIPVALVQHFGTPEVEGGQCRKKWKVAPGVPFNPFPPLPPYPRGSPCPSTSSTQMSQHDGTLAMKHNSSGYCGRTADTGGRVHRNWRNGARSRWPYNYQGRRFPNNHHRFER